MTDAEAWELASLRSEVDRLQSERKRILELHLTVHQYRDGWHYIQNHPGESLRCGPFQSRDEAVIAGIQCDEREEIGVPGAKEAGR